jgi:predicted Fe-Mo cluster-binding NifX family protein
MEGTLLRIAVPLSGETFCAHFGGADRFAIFEGDREHTTITSRHDATPPPHEHGSFPLWLRSQGVTAVIAGGMGARAVQMLDHFGIEVVLGVGGGDPDTLAAAFLKGEIRSTGSSCSGHGLHRCHDHGDSTG